MGCKVILILVASKSLQYLLSNPDQRNPTRKNIFSKVEKTVKRNLNIKKLSERNIFFDRAMSIEIVVRLFTPWQPRISACVQKESD